MGKQDSAHKLKMQLDNNAVMCKFILGRKRCCSYLPANNNTAWGFARSRGRFALLRGPGASGNLISL